jgi:hypothetical protein
MPAAATRPDPIKWAVILIAVNAIGGLIFSLALPDVDDRGTFIAVSTVFTVVMLVTGWFLWNGSRWGSIAALVVQALNILLAIPALFQADPKGMIPGALVSILLSIAAIVLALRPDARAYWRGR